MEVTHRHLHLSCPDRFMPK